LLTGRYSVNELVSILDMGQSRVSRHLKLLMNANLVSVRREGTWAYYEAARPADKEEITPWFDLLSSTRLDLPGAQEDDSRRQICLELRRQKSQKFHDQVAPQWSMIRKELFGNEAVIEHVLKPFKNEKIIADLGCGAGELLPKLVQSAELVIGVDSSPAMLDQARLVIESQNFVDRVELRLGTLEHLPLADSEAGAALLNMVLHHLAEPVQVLKEVRRALCASGRLVVCDLVRHDEEWMRDKYGDLWLGFTDKEIGRFFQQAGFEILSINHYDAPRAGILVAVAQA
ncbi:MAG: metalloregulator ArsR/SmtB family transcription factor, partial [Deltaproteobacteria bacterium]|nr:metalloregulator ArsR/SmtB family transcription factor [Deltaproteobacteria bacterium]